MSHPQRRTIALSMLIVAFIALPVVADDAPAKNEAAQRDTKHAELEVINVTAMPSIKSLTFRGTVRNVYDQPIDGIRLIMQVRSDPTDESPELTRTQQILDAKLAPNAHTAFEIAVTVDPSSLANPGLLLRAFAMKRGDEFVPRPPIWRD